MQRTKRARRIDIIRCEKLFGRIEKNGNDGTEGNRVGEGGDETVGGKGEEQTVMNGELEEADCIVGVSLEFREREGAGQGVSKYGSPDLLFR